MGGRCHAWCVSRDSARWPGPGDTCRAAPRLWAASTAPVAGPAPPAVSVGRTGHETTPRARGREVALQPTDQAQGPESDRPRRSPLRDPGGRPAVVHAVCLWAQCTEGPDGRFVTDAGGAASRPAEPARPRWSTPPERPRARAAAMPHPRLSPRASCHPHLPGSVAQHSWVLLGV